MFMLFAITHPNVLKQSHAGETAHLQRLLRKATWPSCITNFSFFRRSTLKYIAFNTTSSVSFKKRKGLEAMKHGSCQGELRLFFRFLSSQTYAQHIIIKPPTLKSNEIFNSKIQLSRPQVLFFRAD